MDDVTRLHRRCSMSGVRYLCPSTVTPVSSAFVSDNTYNPNDCCGQLPLGLYEGTRASNYTRNCDLGSHWAHDSSHKFHSFLAAEACRASVISRFIRRSEHQEGRVHEGRRFLRRPPSVRKWHVSRTARSSPRLTSAPQLPPLSRGRSSQIIGHTPASHDTALPLAALRARPTPTFLSLSVPLLRDSLGRDLWSVASRFSTCVVRLSRLDTSMTPSPPATLQAAIGISFPAHLRHLCKLA
ncbi:hypothetical protein C8Q79DRAFT_220322 [Trametes meyenii]|nr:hypothetical protein C8Q79DRAFT_220322 [Trametes meyenii]